MNIHETDRTTQTDCTTAPISPGASHNRADPHSTTAWFWKSLGGIFSLALIAYGSFAALTLIAHGERVVEDEFPASSIESIEVRLSNGTVRVLGSGTDRGSPDRRTTDTVSIHGILNDGLFPVRYEAHLEGSTVVVEATGPTGTSDLEIESPPDIAVTVSSDNSRVEVIDMRAGVRVQTGNGDVRATRLAGEISLDTSNGEVFADQLRPSELRVESRNGELQIGIEKLPQNTDVSTRNGDIDIRIAPGSSLAVDARSDNGEVRTQVRTDPQSPNLMHIRSGNGDIDLRYATSG